MKIAFLILAHRQIEIVYKQIDFLDDANHFFYILLDKKYDPEIAQNYRQKANVVFLKNRFPVFWGGFSVVRAEVELIRSAITARDTFDYFVLLSGQCLPIKSKRAIVEFFKKSDGNVFVEAKALMDSYSTSNGLDKVCYPYLFDQLGILKLEYKKLIFRAIKEFLKTIHYQRKIPKNLIPCIGSQWWAIPRAVASYIMNVIEEEPNMIRFFKNTWAPDELLFQTIIYNSKYRNRIVNQVLWYIDWNTNGPPKILTIDDYEQMIKSDKLFARKFDLVASSSLLRHLDYKYIV